MPQSRSLARVIQVVVVASWVGLTACIPYTVGTTAAPVPKGEKTTTMSTWVLPSVGDTTFGSSSNVLMIDMESRWGLDAKSDFGLRVTGGGLVVNSKRLLTGPSSIYDIAIMPGAGIVNWGNHAYFETTLLASKREKNPKTDAASKLLPYFGARVMQVAPLSSSAVHDRPTAGAFLGARIGSTNFGVSPEIGVFYDHSALGMRKNDIIVIPSISLHGSELIRTIGDLIRQAGPFGR